ncbi:aminotransferase class V-fold PLP-dependent enzyme [candidate division KSB3 bacterium]|uniref:cysteine desulfurase n=1 Tax=candidate division KSB3 bacterium TaxID=2044937 RepID=A0A9D5JXC1_9BACT|nr:aminotransferase class V-fold PLP-dependent enzyme [candidate division KSB3 bacterium]MBD3325686.1 aminotransferase class V-fold PLP-dependent enzyme [candidate division KSB3 bacterium]
MIYFDNAATSWPKPPGVTDAIVHFLQNIGASPGRSGHQLALKAGRIVYATREAIAELFHAPDPLRVVFTQNVTESLNLAFNGFLHPGDHVITSSMEHNSVMRPLRALERRGVELTVVPCSTAGLLHPADIEAAIRPNTAMIALNHASNVVGTIQPVTEVGRIARQHDLLFLVDTAQTAGAYPIDMPAENIDLLAFTGHKSLYGPTGTGGLILGERVAIDRLEPLKRGGTGSRSEEEEQPTFLPDVYGSGTMNAMGLAGLLSSVRWVIEQGVETIRAHEIMLVQKLIEGLKCIPGITVYGTQDAARQTATVSCSLATMDPGEMGLRLDEEYDILCRVGLHCSPAAHKTIGTFPVGTVRFGLGFLNTVEEVSAVLTAIEALAKERP